MFAYITGTPFVYIEYFGVSPQWYGTLFGANVVALVIASALNARYVGSFGLLRSTRLSIVLATVGGVALLADALTGFGRLWGIAGTRLLVVGVQAPDGAHSTARTIGRA